MDLISSRSNPKIKQLRQLREHRSHREDDPILVEGIFHVGEVVAAAQSGRLGLESIFYAPDLLKSEFAQRIIADQTAAGLPCYPVAPEVFESVSGKENPQGILALARPQAAGLSSLAPTNFPWGVALVSPQDPGNLGTILRTIDAVGASGLLLLDSNLNPYHPSAVRASMGALFWHPVVQASFPDFTDWAKGQRYTLYGTSAHGVEDYRQVGAYERPCILLLGSEREGLSTEQQAVCDHVLRLPMGGRVTSLNLAVAAGVMLYQMLVAN
jgi:TrmH family RNA methyltransferase